IKIRLCSCDERVSCFIGDERGSTDHIGGTVEHECEGTVLGKSLLTHLLLLSLRWFVRQLPPGIAFGEKRFDVAAGTHPRRVSELESEAIAFKDCGEVELPVEEALLLGNRFGDVQPRMGLKNCLYSGSSTRQSTLVGFEFVQFRPVVDVEHRCLAGFPGGLLTPRF